MNLFENTHTTPYELFHLWFNEAKNHEGEHYNAFVLSTISFDDAKMPDSRVLLAKGFQGEDIRFFTNYSSPTGLDLKQNPFCQINFFWQKTYRQVRLKGKVEKLDPATNNEYFQSRPRGSQLSALASKQSSQISSKEAVEQKRLQLEEEYANKEITCPEFWGGYAFKYFEIEFWQGQNHRFHDRLLFKEENGSWTKSFLSP